MGAIKPTYACMLALTMDLVGGKWKMVILWALKNGVLRFGEIRRMLNGITQKMLTQQLRELEEAGIITRTVYPVVPPKVEYTLTQEGEKLIPALEMLCNWSAGYANTRGIAHHTCSAPPCCTKQA